MEVYFLKESLKKMLTLKTMFSRLMASFLLIIILVSSFYLYSFKVYLNIIEDEMTKNIDERFDSVVVKYDRYFEQIKDLLVQVHLQEAFYPVLYGQELTAFDQKELVERFKDMMYSKNQPEFMKYLKAVFIVTDTSEGLRIFLRGL
jgi:hypothetical protein